MSVIEHANFLARLKAQGYDFGVFYDVGANIGRWSFAAQKVFPEARFELFEPLAGRLVSVDEQSLLEKIPRGTMHAVALSDKTGPTEIKVLGNNGVGSSILILEEDRRNRDLLIIKCPALRMDDIVQEKGLPQPDFIKLDTQAGEIKVLEGAKETLRNSKFILAEAYARRVYGPNAPLFHEVANWLYGHGYVLFELLVEPKEGRDADGTLRFFDAVYINKAVSKFPRAML
jgi:FkbM family methyltransferase